MIDTTGAKSSWDSAQRLVARGAAAASVAGDRVVGNLSILSFEADYG
jgi:hypothetical protein